jgi:hypothetical protein
MADLAPPRIKRLALRTSFNSFIVTLLTPVLAFYEIIYMPVITTQRTRLVDKLNKLVVYEREGGDDG